MTDTHDGWDQKGTGAAVSIVETYCACADHVSAAVDAGTEERSFGATKPLILPPRVRCGNSRPGEVGP